MRAILLLLAVSVLAQAQDRRVVPAGPSRRLALVIGNDAYPWKRLVNSVNDAQALARLLPQVGFRAGDVTLVTNATLKQMQRAAREFAEKLRPDDLALVYYSGHGVEFRGENYLIPVDFPANASDIEVRDEAYSAQQLLRSLEETQARVRLVILDACRDNPLRSTRSGAGGLARMEGEGTLVVFATGAGKTADDNPRGVNGLFTSHLLKALPTPGLTVDQMIKQVAREVYQESQGRQSPAVYGLLMEDMAFVPGVAGAGPKLDPAAEAWALVRNSTDPALVEAFLKEYGNSEFAGAARLKLASLRAPAPVPVSPPAVGGNRKTRINLKDGLTYVWIPPGTFKMGCSPDDAWCMDNERPVVDVTISKGFWLGESEVTQAAYQRVMGRNPSYYKGADRPVDSVAWSEAEKYCSTAAARLPTEAEWEYAARAGTITARYGNLDDVAWYKGNTTVETGTHPVKQKQPNAFGLYDMLGNVWEWVADWYGDKLQGGTDPKGPATATTGKGRVVRGGCWYYLPRNERVSDRTHAVPTTGVPRGGFRCAMD